MRTRITIQRDARPQDSIGELDEDWSDLHTCMARKEPLRGAERHAADVNLAEHSTVFVFRYCSAIADLSTRDRVVEGGRAYDLSSVFNVEGRNEWFEVVGVIRG